MCAILVLTFIGDRVLNGSRGEQIHRQLVAESRSLEQMPNSILLGSVDSFSVWNSHKALVDAKYTTAADYTSISGVLRSGIGYSWVEVRWYAYLKVWGGITAVKKLTIARVRCPLHMNSPDKNRAITRHPLSIVLGD